MSNKSSDSASAAIQFRRRNRKVFAACQRCRFRKIRCDGSFPSCMNCQKVGATCMDPHREKDIPRSYVVSLEDRVKALESIISKRCPDIDLSVNLPVLVAEERSSTQFHPDQRSEAEVQSPDPNNRESASPGLILARTGPGAAFSQLASNHLDSDSELLTHAVALVSLNGSSEPKYLGASSGFSFAKLLIHPRLKLHQPIEGCESLDVDSDGHSQPVEPSIPLPPIHEAIILAEAFFDAVQWQYPFMHKPSFMASLNSAYASSNSKQRQPLDSGEADLNNSFFQVYMVLAIGASTLSQRGHMSIEAGGYYASALQYADMSLYNVSLRTTQNHLLLAMYAMFNPRSDVNIWFVNYLLMASCIDLGLHRNICSPGVNASNGAVLKDEMRKRIFWSCYTLDRNVGTALGRPIGIRHEACDVPLPLNIDDASLKNGAVTTNSQIWSSLSCSIHLFHLAIIITDMKLHLYRVSQELDRIPWPSDLDAWRERTYRDLNKWKAAIDTPSSSQGPYLAHLEVAYHCAVMLLFRPSPRFPQLTVDTACICSDSSVQVIKIFDSLQRYGKMHFTVLNVHDTLMSGLTMLYSAQFLCRTRAEVEMQQLSGNIKTCSSILSAMAEKGWAFARQSMNTFNFTGKVTLKFVQSVEPGAQLENPILTNTNGNDESIKAAQGLSSLNTTSNNHFCSQNAIPHLQAASLVPTLSMTSQHSPSMDQLMGTIDSDESNLFPFGEYEAEAVGIPLDIADWSSWEALIPNWERIF